MPNDDNTVIKEDGGNGYESENCIVPWKNYKDEQFNSNTELELVLKKSFEAVGFCLSKTWLNQEKYVFPMYCPYGKILKPWLEKEDIL